MDESVLQRLAAAVLQARGDRSQRDFAKLLGVSQSTIQSWENARNTPSLENLEKIARIRGELPEEFVAYLYGRSLGETLPFAEKIEGMSCREIAEVMRAISDRLTQ